MDSPVSDLTSSFPEQNSVPDYYIGRYSASTKTWLIISIAQMHCQTFARTRFFHEDDFKFQYARCILTVNKM